METPQLRLENLFSCLYSSGNVGPSHQEVVKAANNYKGRLSLSSSCCLSVLNCYWFLVSAICLLPGFLLASLRASCLNPPWLISYCTLISIMTIKVRLKVKGWCCRGKVWSAEQIKVRLEVMCRTNAVKSEPKFNVSPVWLPHLSCLGKEEGMGMPLLCCSSVPVYSPCPYSLSHLSVARKRGQVRLEM